MMTDSENRDAAWQKLDIFTRSKNLVELHTHLMGMGSADFWVNRIMETYLPRICDPPAQDSINFRKQLTTLLKDQLDTKHIQPSINQSLRHLVDDLQNGSLSAIEDRYLFAFNDQLFHHDNLSLEWFMKTYTDDVVYSDNVLMMLFDLPDKPVHDRDQNGSKRPRLDYDDICTNTLQYHLGLSLNEYIIFNARRRRFDLIRGVKNTQLIKQMESNKIVRAAVRNGFSMLSNNGDCPSGPDLNTYKDAFTPQFYPKRFKMKDCIYEQRLEVLSILLNQVIARYDKAGVHYVEFSMSVNDLLNIDIWKHLVTKAYSSPIRPLTAKAPARKRKPAAQICDNVSEQSTTADSQDDDDGSLPESLVRYRNLQTSNTPKWAKILGMYHDRPRAFFYCFLAAFNRTSVYVDNKRLNGRDDALSFLIENRGESAKRLCRGNNEADADRNAERAFLEIFGSDGPVRRIQRDVLESDGRLHQWWKGFVVGCDWVGDEYGLPYCALIHSDFIGPKGIVWRMRQYQKRFGIRIHCGESLPLPPSEPNADSTSHIAFETHLDIALDALKRIQNGIKRHLRIGHGVAFMHKNSRMARLARDFLRDEQIVCELNMTSNLYLLLSPTYQFKQTENSVIIREFIREKIPVVLSTDDDGVWVIRKCKLHYHHVSVAGEYCKVIEIGGIRNEHEVQYLIETAKLATFS